MIIEFNGRPVTTTNELVKMVTATKPGTSVPVKVMRSERGATARERTLNVTVEELDLEAEQGRQAPQHAARRPPQEQGADSFGLTLEQPDAADRARSCSCRRDSRAPSSPTSIPDGPSAGALRPGDVILSVNGQAVVERGRGGARAAARSPAGRIARILVWRGDGEVFVTVRKE